MMYQYTCHQDRSRYYYSNNNRVTYNSWFTRYRDFSSRSRTQYRFLKNVHVRPNRTNYRFQIDTIYHNY